MALSIIYILFLLSIVTFQSIEFQKRIINSPITNLFPYLKVHHVIVLSKPNTRNIYTIDFTPVHQSFIKLLLGKTVQAEVRVRNIDVYFNTSDVTVLDLFYKINKDLTHTQSIELTKHVIHKITDDDIKMKIKKMQNWGSKMNLYKNNCQHFSSKNFDIL
jgi:hypothetical protein